MKNEDAATVAKEVENFETSSSDLPEASPEPAKEEKEQAAPEPEKAPVGEAKAEPSEKEGEELADGVDAPAENTPAKKRGSFQKRINEQTRALGDEKRKNEALSAKLKELKDKKEEPAAAKAPVESDFDTYEEYLTATATFEADEKKAPAKAAPAKEEPGGLTDSQKTSMEVVKEFVSTAEKPEDFEKVALAADVPVTGEMLEALAECDDPAKVLYHLGQNKDIAAKIAEGTPAQQMRAITKLDGTVKPSKPAQVTTTDDPPEPVNGSSAQEKPLKEMTFKEHEEHMNKREQQGTTGW